jgi:lysophospholipase L1-like esterase
MVEAGLRAGVKILLLTPTHDMTQAPSYAGDDKDLLTAHANQIRQIADEHNVGLADSFAAFEQYTKTGDLSDLLSWNNHPNRSGHELVATELLRWFPA